MPSTTKVRQIGGAAASGLVSGLKLAAGGTDQADNQTSAHMEEYVVIVKTGTARDENETDGPGYAGTDATVSITLVGRNGQQSENIMLGRSKLEATGGEYQVEIFADGCEDRFVVLAPDINQLQDLTGLIIGHDGTGDHPEWFLDKVTVKTRQAEQRQLLQQQYHQSAVPCAHEWTFVCRRWLAADRGDNLLELHLKPYLDGDLDALEHEILAPCVVGDWQRASAKEHHQAIAITSNYLPVDGMRSVATDQSLNAKKLHEHLRKTFEEVDVDKTGLLNRDEIKKLIQSVGDKMGEKTLDLAMERMDPHGLGGVTFAAFEKWWKYKLQGYTRNLRRQVRAAFEMLDEDESGFLEKDEIGQVLVRPCRENN
eukprot:SAG22_NODE_879_length_6707_cov_14.725787_1_plen_369_part_00